MSLRSGGLFCPIPDATAAPADRKGKSRNNPSLGVRCSVYASSEPYDLETGPTRLYKPSVTTGPDGAREVCAFIESDSPYIAIELALEGTSNNLHPLVWNHPSPLYARMCMDGSAHPVVDRILDSHSPNPSFLDYHHPEGNDRHVNIPFCFKQRGLNEGAQPNRAVSESVIDSYSSIVVEVGTCERPAAPPLASVATSRALAEEVPAESSASASRREARSGASRANLGQSLKYLHARLSHFIGLDETASKSIAVQNVPPKNNIQKIKALVRFTFFYKSKTRLRACGLLDDAARGPAPAAPAFARPFTAPASRPAQAPLVAADTVGQRARAPPQSLIDPQRAPQPVAHPGQTQNQSQSQTIYQNQNQNQNQNHHQYQRQYQYQDHNQRQTQNQRRIQTSDPRPRPHTYSSRAPHVPAALDARAADPGLSANASAFGAKPPLIAPSPSIQRAEDEAREAKRVKREAIEDNLQSAQAPAARQPLVPSPRSAQRSSIVGQLAHQPALHYASRPSAGPNVPRVGASTEPSRSTIGRRGQAVIDLTSDSDKEEEEKERAPAQVFAPGTDVGAARDVKPDSNRQMLARPPAHRDQNVAPAQPAAAAAAQHEDQHPDGPRAGDASPAKAVALGGADRFVAHVEAILGPATAASVYDVLIKFGLNISLGEVRMRFTFCDEGGKEEIWKALDDKITRFNRGVIMGLIEQRGAGSNKR